MNNANQRALLKKFSCLSQWNTGFSTTRVSHDFDQFVLICLKIVDLLCENKDILKVISKEFSIIIENDYFVDEAAQLRGDFARVDISLDNSMRGFASLLDSILEDNSITTDRRYLLKKMPKNYQELIGPVETFLDSMEDCRDILYRYGSNSSMIISASFMVMVRRLLCIIDGRQEKVAHKQICEWMGLWGTSEQIRQLFNAS